MLLISLLYLLSFCNFGSRLDKNCTFTQKDSLIWGNSLIWFLSTYYFLSCLKKKSLEQILRSKHVCLALGPNQTETSHLTQRRPFREVSLQWYLSISYHTGVWKQSLERLMRHICFVILGHFQSKLPALLKRILNPIQHGHFQDCSHKGKAKRPLPSLKSVTYRLQWWTLAKLYPTKRIFKIYMNHVSQHLSSADISIFSPEINQFWYIKK